MPDLHRFTPSMSLHAQHSFDILLIKRNQAEARLPPEQGVGLARKIAADCACWLIENKHSDRQFMFCSDADVIFPDDYFSVQLQPKSSAATLAFTHIDGDDEQVNSATEIYQHSLNDYVAGLKAAGSSYAFHTIGSCLIINSRYYIGVRGFPKRSAAEDFYLLNKLQKLAAVEVLEKPCLHILARASERVPFGTGPAVKKIIHQQQAPALFYHPGCYRVLKQWLDYLQGVCEQGEFYQPDEELQALVKCFKLESMVAKIFSNHGEKNARSKALEDWFDAFKTLKLIHYLSDRHYPKQSQPAMSD